MREKRLGRNWTACLILMLLILLPIQIGSDPQGELDQLWEEISSTIEPDMFYEGSLVKDALWELILAADRAIVMAADEAAEQAAAEAIRQIQPELEGWKARAKEAEKRNWRLLFGVGGGALLTGVLLGWALSS